MAAGHGHGHGHAAPQGTATGGHRRRLMLVLLFTASVLVVQVVGAILSGSLALLADAGHMAADSAGIVLALGAVTLAQRAPTSRRTFGWQRAEILAAAANSVILFGLALYILVEAVQRLSEPPEVKSGLMLVVALVGLAANTASLLLLHRAQSDSLNLRGAYLEVLGDLLGSVAVVVAALVITLTGWQRADAVASGLVALMILPRAWGLLWEAIDVLLEAVPRGVDMEAVRHHITHVPGVVDVHDLHAWTITSGLPVLSAHVVVDEATMAGGHTGRVLDALCTCLAGHFDVEHSTFQIESATHREHESPVHD
ncbi:cobalt-zinc-cadmium efflux system protein [Actinopolymorpha cephalotaxi]|uniref:Cobalt-zinc-cadmium efflux system protein n=1 Tax=Actinopolymorpha cephalotaxi TaxID=504797 RepID=A0A1I2YDH7_9ACTN|nr:cation diffusion facilitator family transporter [Actinopolymorpha cephalotaxi]NYH87022.1 cobalt-zinc-cadmium efflux system protein [Actinopolymorpha cephalotaxi]SFH23764.1 cobalt-zinc-cadmium efflux system protein [Actinopolymorpha cephalotaxi]